jgi:hypothetical protein
LARTLSSVGLSSFGTATAQPMRRAAAAARREMRMSDSLSPSMALGLPAFAETRPRDFSARLSRRGAARSIGGSQRQRPIGRLAVLAAAIAVPAMAAPGEWTADSALEQAATPQPMAFEIPGESFPGSAFYYLADEPYVALPAASRGTAEAGLALPRAAGRIDSGPVAPALHFAGSVTDRMRAQQCLTMAIYYEAASEADAGQRAVAQVVLNRVAHPAYPDTVCGVVFQGSERSTGCQFSFTCDGSLARKPARMWWDRAANVARAALSGAVYAPVGLATHYHTVQIHPYWADSLDQVGTIGAHRFYRWRGAAGRRAAFSDAYFGGEPVAAPRPRTAETTPAEADPLTLARAYEAALQQTVQVTPASAAASPAPAYSAEIEARGGDALFRSNAAPATGQVREEYAHSGQWLRQP